MLKINEYQKLNLTAGESRVINFVMKDFDNGGALPLTDCIIRWVLCKTEDGPVLIEKDTIAGGITITDAAGGLFAVKVEPGDTLGYKTGEYYQEVQVEDSYGNKNPTFSGPVLIKSSPFR